MLKEEKDLREHINGSIDARLWVPSASRLITKLVRAVREDCAKVAESEKVVCDGKCVCAKEIAAAIRGGRDDV